MMVMLAEDVEEEVVEEAGVVEDAVGEEEAVVQDLQNLASRKLHQ